MITYPPGSDPIPTSERMVYDVHSDSGKGTPYRVDLLANNGAGQCSCRDHQIRRQPFLDRGGDPFTREGACKHTIKTRTFFLKALLRALAKSEET